MTLEQSRSKQLVLSCVVYQDKSPNTSDNSTWIGAETSCGIEFDISLRTQPPPGFSTLHIRTDVGALPDTPTSKIYLDGVKRRMSMEAVASCRDVIVMHTGVETGTYPCFRHDYYLLKKDAMLRLPRMPGPHQINLGILRHQEGDQYTVVVLKEGGLSLSPDPVEGPYVCIYSTSTNKWTSRTVSLPACWNNWDMDMVLADGTTFWWVDLHRGILSYDIVAAANHHQDKQPAKLGFIPLPSCIQPDRDEREYHLRQDRCVGVSAGEFRSGVHVFEDRVKAWSWRSGGKQWLEDYETKFADLWGSKSYSESGLPKCAPEYPTVDPYQPNLVNFFLPIGKRYDGYLIGVDLASMEVIYRGQLHKGLLNMVTGLEIIELSGEAEAKKESSLVPHSLPTKRRRLEAY